MKTASAFERSSLSTEALPKAVTTNADYRSVITRDYGRQDAAHESWDLIEKQLIEWGCDPSQLDEEGTVAPSPDTIQLAIQVAIELGRQDWAAPTRVVPDAHGGVVFEFQRRFDFESLHIMPDGNIERRLFKNHRLVVREIL
jgi:hypothetical protein